MTMQDAARWSVQPDGGPERACESFDDVLGQVRDHLLAGQACEVRQDRGGVKSLYGRYEPDEDGARVARITEALARRGQL